VAWLNKQLGPREPPPDQKARGRVWLRDKCDTRKVAIPESLGWQDEGNRWGADERQSKPPPVPSGEGC